ncbi:MAG: hypothetical protein E7161_01060 [Firmicutes bacterium]|nr:hypothetical protein [Bacillota bacterium]
MSFIFKAIKTIIIIAIILIGISLFIAYDDIDYKKIDEIQDTNFKQNLIDVLNELNWEIKDIKNICDEGEWYMGNYYSFYYHGTRYYVSVYETGNIYSITNKKISSQNVEYIYKNEKINISDDNENSFTLQWNSLGEYGKYDTYDGEKYIRFYVPSGTYIVKGLNKNSILFIEKKKIYKNSSGYDESQTVKKITLSKIGDKEEITIKSDECISLVNNSYVSLQKK